MDRTQSFLKSSKRPPGISPSHVEAALFSAAQAGNPRALFAPLHYESGYAYPLVVWLHGLGDDEHQLMRVMPQVNARNYVAVAPRGARIETAAAPVGERYGWQQSEEHIQHAEQSIFESIEAARARFHIAGHRIFLAGFGCGGTMAFRVALNHAGRFAGALSLCGPLPAGGAPLKNLAEARRLPALLAVGRDSRHYPPSEVCRHLRLLHAAGIPVTLRQYPCGQAISEAMLADMNRWIMELVTGGDRGAQERP